MLMRFDPFRELDRWTNGAGGRPWPSLLAMDAYRRGDRFYVHFDLPGARSDSIELSVEKNVLTVKASRSWDRQPGDDVAAAERPQGEVSRQLFLGEGLDADRIDASYVDGVLTVTIPVAEKAKARRVEIQTSGNGAHQPVDAVPAGVSNGASVSAN
jgi:HSP20 family protein